jgi:hypothetical protein
LLKITSLIRRNHLFLNSCVAGHDHNRHPAANQPISHTTWLKITSLIHRNHLFLNSCVAGHDHNRQPAASQPISHANWLKIIHSLKPFVSEFMCGWPRLAVSSQSVDQPHKLAEGPLQTTPKHTWAVAKPLISLRSPDHQSDHE